MTERNPDQQGIDVKKTNLLHRSVENGKKTPKSSTLHTHGGKKTLNLASQLIHKTQGKKPNIT